MSNQKRKGPDEKKTVPSKKITQAEQVSGPDDSLASNIENQNDTPRVFRVSKRDRILNRKDFIKTSAKVTGLTTLGALLSRCEQSEYDIIKSGDNCSCHVVCGCDTESADKKTLSENNFRSEYDSNLVCTCHTVCTCNSVCTCDTVCSCNYDCSCDSHTSSGSYTYWYPN